MQNRYICIEKLKKALICSMNGGKYNVAPSVESDFILLVLKNLLNTELEPFIEDIKTVLIQLMACADDLDIERN